MTRKKIIITGSSQGIGKEIAILFSENEWDVACCGRNELALAKLATELHSDQTSKHIVEQCDVSKLEELQQFYEMIIESWGNVDVLVNNAGIFIPGTVHEEEEGILDRMLDTNLKSTYNMSRLVIPDMKKQANGHIINICSIASVIPYANGGSYSISKYAQYGLTKVLREELKPFNIGVTAILPGATLTSSWSGTDLPKERFVDPKHVAALVFQCTIMSQISVVEELIVRPMAGDIT